MSEYSEIEAAIANQELERARELLRPLLEQESKNPQLWYLASKAARNEAQRRYFLEQAFQADPLYHIAANELHTLNMPAVPEPQVASEAVPVYASARKRFAAFFVDINLVYGLNLLFYYFFLAQLPNLSLQILLYVLSFMALLWIYNGYSYTKWNGRSLGARIFRLRVLRRDGKSLTWGDAFVRCVVGYFASGIAFGAGFTWQFFNPQHQAWHDIFANTIVVEER